MSNILLARSAHFMYEKIVLPRNWDFISSLLDFIPNSILAGSIVDHVHLSSDVDTDARILKDIDLEIDQQDYQELLSKCNIAYSGEPVKEIKFLDLDLRLTKFELYTSILIYQGSYKNKPIDVFVIPEKRDFETFKIKDFDIRIQTIFSRKEVIDSVLEIDAKNAKPMTKIWLKNKQQILSKRKNTLDKKLASMEGN